MAENYYGKEIPGCTSHSFGGYFTGPIKSSAGNIYCFVLHGTAASIAKTTNGGTTWSYSDCATSFQGNANIWQVGDTIYVFFIQSTTYYVGVITYNMATDSWGTAQISTLIAGTATIWPGYNICGTARSTGEVVVYYGAGTVGGWSEIRWATWTAGGGWSAATALTGAGGFAHYGVATIAINTSDNTVYFVYYFGKAVWCEPLSSGNTLGLAEDTGLDVNAAGELSVGIARVVGTSLAVPCAEKNGINPYYGMRVSISDRSASPLAWNKSWWSLVRQPYTGYNGGGMGACLGVGSDLWAVWVNNTDLGTYWDTITTPIMAMKKDAAAPTEIYAPDVQAYWNLSANGIGPDIHFVFESHNGNKLWYGKYTPPVVVAVHVAKYAY